MLESNKEEENLAVEMHGGREIGERFEKRIQRPRHLELFRVSGLTASRVQNECV